MRPAACSIVVAAAALVLVFAGATATAASRQLKVALVLGTSIHDPYEGIAYRGLVRAVKELGVTGRAFVAGPKEGALATLSRLARQRYDVIIVVGFQLVDALDAVAIRFPSVKFVNVDAPWSALPHRPKNVQGTDYKVERASYLAGYLAALMERLRRGRDVISSVGGVKIPTVDDFIAGFQAGARKANARIVTLNEYTGDFLDAGKCRAVALDQIAKGSGVVFQVAGPCGLGAIAAAREKSVFAIGVDADQSYLGPHVLTSVVKRMDVAVFEAIRSVQRGAFRGGRTVVLSLRNDGVALGELSPRVPRRLVVAVERVRRLIVSGRIGGIPTTVR